MNIEIITGEPEFAGLKNSWNSLLAESESGCIFLTWEWLHTWWEHFKENSKLFIIKVSDEDTGDIIGIAPLCFYETRMLKKIRIKRLAFLGSKNVSSDFLNFIIRPGKEEEVTLGILAFLDERRSEWDVIELSDINSKSKVASLIRSTNNFHTLERQIQVCPYIKLPQTFDCLVGTLSRKMRSNLKRGLKKIRDSERFKFTRLNSSSELHSGLAKLFDLHERRFLARRNGSASSFSMQMIKDFHYDLIDKLFENDWLRFYFLEYFGKAVASLYAFKYNRIVFFYQSGSDPLMKNYSLGTLLLGLSIEDSIREGSKEFNFLRGKEAYKFCWTDEIVKTADFALFNNTFPGKLCFTLSRIKNKTKRIGRLKPW